MFFMSDTLSESVCSSEGLIAVIMWHSSSDPMLTAGSLLFEGKVKT